ncbi:MAG: hypothetical protein NZL83_01905 [Candidatus Absconditabacterales bacterium]|nr:hypothetical protein [Candidatus Absconditabacterales bacterium]
MGVHRGIHRLINQFDCSLVHRCQKTNIIEHGVLDVTTTQCTKRVALHNKTQSRGYDGRVDSGYDKHCRVNHNKNDCSNTSGVHIKRIET